MIRYLAILIVLALAALLGLRHFGYVDPPAALLVALGILAAIVIAYHLYRRLRAAIIDMND